MAVALVAILNGGDNIGLGTPIFAARTVPEDIVILVVFVLLVPLLVAIARRLVNYPIIRGAGYRYAEMLTPFFLIGIGVVSINYGDLLINWR